MQVIIYQPENSPVAVVWPAQEYVEKYGVDAIAKKDVPHGLPYKIIDSSDLPTDRTFRNAWEVNPAILTDGVGAESFEFPPELIQAVNNQQTRAPK